MNNNREEWGVLESLFLKGEQLTAAEREVLLEERSVGDHLRSRLWALWRQGDRTESFLAANVLSNFTVFADGRTAAEAMRFQPGQLVARRFEIQEFLGEGGMGSVYRARDTTLGRVVALKILQWSGVGDEIRQRADREAHAISALNHPGICTLFDMYWDRTTPILVMEYLQGETLDQRLTRGPLKPEEFRAIGLQICEALTYAHGSRVLHGDLKPANIMLTERGAVLLDFGLSRSLGEPAAGAQEDGQAASYAVPQGWVAGTPAYMSPEQIRGQALDARSDVFSLGCVLYKMASGKGPFHRNSTEDTFQAILKAAAEPPPAQLSGVPRRVRSLIATCLRLEANDRFQSAAEVTKSLRRATSARVRARLTVAGVALLFAAIVTAVWFGTRHEGQPLVARQITFDEGVSNWPALSRDGKMLAFASDRGGKPDSSIWIQQIDGRQPVQVAVGACGSSMLAFSPDGTKIAFHASCGGVDGTYVVPTTGGKPQLLAKGGGFVQFSPDGKWIAFIKKIDYSKSELVVLPALGGAARKLAKINAYWSPVWSNDSSAILLCGYPGATLDVEQSYDPQLFEWFVIPIDGSPAIPLKVRTVFPSKSEFPVPIAWQGQRLIYWTSAAEKRDFGQLRIRRDETWHIVSRPIGLKTGVQPEAAASVAGSRLVFAAGDGHFSVATLQFDTNVPKALSLLQVVPGTMNATLLGVSPDGNKVAYTNLTNNPDDSGLYLRNLSTGKDRYLEVPGKRVFDVYPTDQSKVMLVAGSPSAAFRDSAVYLTDVDKKRTDVLCTRCCCPAASPDGSWLFVKQWDNRQSILLSSSGRRQNDALEDSQHISMIQFSADGKWIAFLYSRDKRIGRLYVAPFRGGVPVPKEAWITVTRDQGEHTSPNWSSDGRVIYYLSTRDGYWCVDAQQLDLSKQQRLGEPIEIYHAHGTPFIPADSFLSVARDKLTFEVFSDRANIWLAELPPE